jgi:serine/threonine protein kinase
MHPLIDPLPPAVGEAETAEAAKTVTVGQVPVFRAAPADGRDLRHPDVGDTFLGFSIVGELGRGAFARVYLAREQALADRPVALKVSSELPHESRLLAQLQHTNIVPVYSVHRAGRFTAVCMPYFGLTTLADVLRELRAAGGLPESGRHFVSTLGSRRGSTQLDLPSGESPGSGVVPRPGEPALPLEARPTFELLGRFSFVEAVLWLGARLADGLAHAHERGIVHRDLKPANILLADDGRPMILDFNLSAEAAQTASSRGGTVPYMAPEQLAQAGPSPHSVVDGRADVYALGLVLYELLTGRHAFPHRGGSLTEALPALLDDRRQPPTPRAFNRTVTPAVEAIIRRCLAFDTSGRYASAHELREDLDRQLEHLPLKHAPEPSLAERAAKWARRHPRLTSAWVTGSAAALLVGAMALFVANLHRDTKTEKAVQRQRNFVAGAAAIEPELTRAPDEDDRRHAAHKARERLVEFTQIDLDRIPPADAAEVRRRAGQLLLLTTQVDLDQARSVADVR